MKSNFVPQHVNLLALGAVLVASLLLYLAQPVQAASNWYVTPSGSGNRSGQSWDNALGSIQQALDRVQPGDTIYLGNGDYYEALTTTRHGEAKAPITISGGPAAILRGADGKGRIFQINHDYYVLDGWTINGYNEKGLSSGNFRDKLIYVHGQSSAYNGEVRRGPRGLEIRNMQLLNAGGECIRLRYFVQEANIHHNTIRNCGFYDFVFSGGGKNGEGIYIGTSFTQWGDGKNPTNEADGSNNNHIHHNTINTQGNECVEVKEGGTDNLVEYNDCTGNKDPNSAGLGARGDGNTFRFNTIYGNSGAGIRYGGHVVNGHEYGVDNSAYANTIYANAGGGIKFQVAPQAVICGNRFSSDNGQSQSSPATGSYADEYQNQVSAACDFAQPTPPAATATQETQPTATVPPAPTATATASATQVAATPTTLPSTATSTTTATPSATPTLPALPAETPATTPTATPVADTAMNLLYLSSTSGGHIGTIRFKDEDIVAFDRLANHWQLYFDGSDVGISKADIDALDILSDGSLILSFLSDTDTPGLGEVDDSDLVRFVPTTLGPTTAGHFQFYLDGSDIGLTTGGEDIDAVTMRQDGTLLISTKGEFTVADLQGNDSDLLAFSPQSLGEETRGLWSIYQRGNDLGLQSDQDEDLFGLWLDEHVPNQPTLYLNTKEEFAVDQLSGDENDLIGCPLQTGSACLFQRFWDGDEHDFGDETLDALAMNNTLVNAALVVAADGSEEDGGAEDDVEPASDELPDEETSADPNALPYQIYLPALTN